MRITLVPKHKRILSLKLDLVVVIFESSHYCHERDIIDC